MKPFSLHQPAGRSDSGTGPLLAGELHGHEAYWRQIEDDVVQVGPLSDGALFCWAVPDYVPADQVAALPDLVRPEVTERMATLVVQGTTPGAELTMRTQELVREYGLDEVGWSYRVGDLAYHLDRQRSDRRPGLVRHPLWQPQHLKRGPPAPAAGRPAGRDPPARPGLADREPAAFERLPARPRAVLQRVRFTLADATAMDYAVNVDGLDPLSAALHGRTCRRRPPVARLSGANIGH